MPAIADYFTATDPAITFPDALARARQVEACKNLLHLTPTVRPTARVASTALTPSIYSLLGLPWIAALQAPPKQPDENAKALAELKEALFVCLFSQLMLLRERSKPLNSL